MNNPENGKVQQSNFEKEHALLDQELQKLKIEQEKLLEKLKLGSSVELLERFKKVQEELEALKARVEVWVNENKDAIFSKLKEKLFELRIMQVRNVALHMLRANSTSFTEAIYKHAVENNAFRVFEIIGSGDSYVRRLGEDMYISQVAGEQNIFDTFFFDQGVEAPFMSIRNLEIFSPQFAPVRDITSYSRWTAKINNSSDFFRLSSFADFYYSQFGKEYYLPGLDSVLYIYNSIIEAENSKTDNIFADKLLELVSQKTEKGRKVIGHANFIFPGCAFVHFHGNFVFPILIYDFENNKFSFSFSDIRREANDRDFFVLFKK